MSQTEHQARSSEEATARHGSISADYSVSRVEPQSIDAVWPQIAPMVRRGLKHGAGDSITEEQILHALYAGQMELWAIHNGEEIIAGLVLQIIQRSKGPALIVIFQAGRDFALWSERVNGLIRDYADLIGAYTVEAVCRKGAAKWLEDLGWKRKAITMAMEMNNGR